MVIRARTKRRRCVSCESTDNRKLETGGARDRTVDPCQFAGHFPRGCLYADTAEPAVPTPVLNGDVRADVVVIGGGVTGLSTALHLAERGARVVLLEAEVPGWGVLEQS